MMHFTLYGVVILSKYVLNDHEKSPFQKVWVFSTPEVPNIGNIANDFKEFGR